MKNTKLNPDGSCPNCLGGWLCRFHQIEGVRREREQANGIRLAAEALRQQSIQSIMTRYELESDEFYTAQQKAERIWLTEAQPLTART